MARSGGRGSQTLALLVLIALVGGAGGWNYKRNVEADEAEPRPFRGYSDADLEALTEAYRQELDVYAQRYTAATGAKVRVADGRLLGDQIAEFERVQRISRETRELGARISEREAALAKLDAERAKRVEESQVVMHFLKRVFVYRG